MDDKPFFTYKQTNMDTGDTTPNQAPAATREDVLQAGQGMFRDGDGRYRDVDGTLYMSDGVPVPGYENTPSMRWNGQWGHPQGSGLHPADYPGLDKSFYADGHSRLKVKLSANATGQPAAAPMQGDGPAAPAGLQPGAAPQTPPPGLQPGAGFQAAPPAPAKTGEEWTAGRVFDNIREGLSDPRLAEGMKIAGEYGLYGAALGAASIGASATAGALGVSYGPAAAAALGSLGTNAAARAGGLAAAGSTQARRGAEALKNGAREAGDWLASPAGQLALQRASEIVEGTLPGPPPPNPLSTFTSLFVTAYDKLKEQDQ